MVQTLRVIIPLFIGLTLLSSCSSEEKKADTPEGAYAIAEEFAKEDRYEIAIQKYNDVRNKFPYSPFALKAELSIADTYFKKESFPEAQIAYQAFRDLHPTHPKIDYVIFQIAMSYYSQIPDTVDRDITLSNEAIATFEEIITKYPKSEHFVPASEKKLECRKKLAEKELYIADFYFKHNQCDSALPRYEGLLKSFAQLGYEPGALKNAGICSFKLGIPEKTRVFLGRLEKEFPNSDDLVELKKALTK